ncbi:MAG: electron transfer flavoprotein subunit alpha, partial [Planctomycetes bacterium]|nr:electron transfer flavoprotein subunit alpha [Planctomycetota bacterium]
MMQTPSNTERAAYKNVWVVAEMLDGKVQSVTHELLGAARRLADARKSEVCCVVMGNDINNEAEKLFAYQADSVIVVDDPSLEQFVDEIQAKALNRLIEKHKPEIVLCGATTRGRALIPRVAVMTNAGLTADCTGLDIEPESGLLLQTRPAFGGNIMAT